jgi:ABC-type transporter Mla subunit MlaD
MMLLAATALVAALLGALVWRWATRTHVTADAMAARLEGRSQTVSGSFDARRADLVQARASIEHLLWSLTRLDETIDSASAAVAQRRALLDDLRPRLHRAAGGVERTKRAVHTAMRAIELMRAMG